MKKHTILIFFISLLILVVACSCQKQEKEYIFIYNSNTEESIEPELVLERELETKQMPNAQREGYTFDGWYFDSHFEHEYSVENVKEKVVYLYAKYTINEYKVRIHIEDKIMEISYKYGEWVELPTLNQEGYVVEGLYLDLEYEEPYEYTTMPAKDIDVYVKWEKIPENKYLFIYYSNTVENIAAESILESELETRELPIAEKEGYTFKGWYLDESLETQYNPKAILENNVIYLYAKHTINEYKMIVHNEDSEQEFSFKYDEKVELPELTKDGYVVEGLYLDLEYEEPYEYTTMPAKDIDVYVKWEAIHIYEISITSNILGAVNIIGETFQRISSCEDFEEVYFEENIGYKYLYYIINGTSYYGNKINLTSLDINEDLTIEIVSDYATYELPIVNINTFNQEIQSKEIYTDMTFSIDNSETHLTNVTGGIRLRGNTTSGYPKKPYRIKFDKKQSLFGLAKAKSWVLLAEYLDPSVLHNYTALSLGNQMEGLNFTPTPNQVNVYLNGEYIGIYTICEQVQENEGRMGIEIDITEDMIHLKDFNFFLSMDSYSQYDEGAILDETYFYFEEYDKFFELKYPEKENFLTEEQFDQFRTELKVYLHDILEAFSTYNVQKIKDEVNLNSLADYFIIDQLMGDYDHADKSFNMYYTHTSSNEIENNKLNFGPIWDYDWCLYTPWTGMPNTSYDYENTEVLHYSNQFFLVMVEIPEFYNIVKEHYFETISSKLLDIVNEIEIYQIKIIDSILLNEKRWYPEQSGISINNIIYLKNFLRARKKILDQKLDF